MTAARQRFDHRVQASSQDVHGNFAFSASRIGKRLESRRISESMNYSGIHILVLIISRPSSGPQPTRSAVPRKAYGISWVDADVPSEPLAIPRKQTFQKNQRAR